MQIHVWAFLGVSVAVILLPGPDTALVTKNALVHGRRAAFGSSLGVSTGLLVWTIAAAVGAAALLRESATAFLILKLAGAIYLIWLGLQALRSAGHVPDDRLADAGEGRGAAFGFRQGVLSDLGNPKIGVFFTTLLPQFVSGEHSVLVPFLLLGLIFVAITLAWLCVYSTMALRMSATLRRASVKRALDRITGCVLIAFGIRVALARR